MMEKRPSSCTEADLVRRWMKARSDSEYSRHFSSSSSSSSSSASSSASYSAVRFHEGLILKPLRVLASEPGRFVCAMTVPARLTNIEGLLHEGVIASLVDNVGAAAFITMDGITRVSVDLNVTYMEPAHIQDEIEIEAQVLKYGVPIGTVLVNLVNKTTGKMIAQGRHTMFRPISKL